MTPEIFASDPSWPYSKAKTAVLTAASAVIREEGPRAATLKNIATKAGITEPAIFRHFEGVDGLFGGLFHAYERTYGRSAKAFEAEGKGLAKLKEASFALVGDIAASRDFAYVLINARHVFRGYPELKAKIVDNDAKDQGRVLACVNEGMKAGDIRSDVDPVSVAVAVIGGMHSTAVAWIESGFGFDLVEMFADRWDDLERMIAAKPGPKARDSKAARERAASYFPQRKARGASKAAPKPAAKKAAKAQAAKSKAPKAQEPKAKAPKAQAAKAQAPKAAAKKQGSKGK
jgi:AcrR family transcriptional regulator